MVAWTSYWSLHFHRYSLKLFGSVRQVTWRLCCHYTCAPVILSIKGELVWKSNIIYIYANCCNFTEKLTGLACSSIQPWQTTKNCTVTDEKKCVLLKVCRSLQSTVRYYHNSRYPASCRRLIKVNVTLMGAGRHQVRAGESRPRAKFYGAVVDVCVLQPFLWADTVSNWF